MTRVEIAVAPRPYRAIIENGTLERAGALLRPILDEAAQLFVISVLPVRKWSRKLLSSLKQAGFSAQLIEMPDGERHKKLATVETLSEKLAAAGADRSSVIVALGGGLVGDVAGLTAALYMRGIDVVQIPTTVLAQVDASIGGKTGVNLRAGKNLVGAFHQPRVVLIDPDVLASLPDRQFRAGLFESLKCGVIGKPELFIRMESTSVRDLRNDPEALQWIIAESVKLKAGVVAADEREHGLRRILNFGHTIGHALEAETAYRYFLHGEAVAWGMMAATHIAAANGSLDSLAEGRITAAIARLGPLPGVQVNPRRILRRLQSDKKTLQGAVHFVLPREIGKVDIVNNVPDELILNSLERLRRLSEKGKSHLRSGA
ncbi:MAG TPA: 3-dehydroquinate synthase [Terriglobales bacterium]|nr:3-dehydroquinate synthase [Terriglobales bacterium]